MFSANNDKVKISTYSIEFFRDIFLTLCGSVNGSENEIFAMKSSAMIGKKRTRSHLERELLNI